VVEMDLGRKNPTTHVPKTIDAIKYFELKLPIVKGNAYTVEHSFLEICTFSAQ